MPFTGRADIWRCQCNPGESADRARRRAIWDLDTADTGSLVTTLIALALHSATLDAAHQHTGTAAQNPDTVLATVAEHLKARPRHEFFAGTPNLNSQSPAAKTVAALRLLAYTAARPAPPTLERLAVDARSTVLAAAAHSPRPDPTADSM
ncbi:hypothetical protein [Streptomyces sp. CBMA152]|uniref:hypothetical protein n=1 Tax=Streptomyces sp. CBMA152 TaxID=1896312 RepID=UPI0016614A47|nr:hypothetical protein [Streptomyces sp. CBMA152]MBD0746634.1 hypothetical protein [Streptomyces sp. CBMA152]